MIIHNKIGGKIMYYQNYEDYMRAVLGYPQERREEYVPCEFEQGYYYENRLANTKELENCYPQIYKIINPVVCEVCGKYRGEYTKESVDMLVNEVYKRISMNNEVNIKVQIDNRSQEKDANRNIAPCNCTGVNTLKSNGSVNCNKNNDESKRNTEEENNRQIRQNNNQFLNDLIRILLLNQILGGGGFFPRKAYTSANAS